MPWLHSRAEAWTVGFLSEATCLYGLVWLAGLLEGLQASAPDDGEWIRHCRDRENGIARAGYFAAVALCLLAAQLLPPSWFGSSLAWAWVSGVLCGFTGTGVMTSLIEAFGSTG